VRQDGHEVPRPAGTIRIEADALSTLVVNAAELVEGARVRRPRRGLEVAVSDGRARVSLELAVRQGLVLPELAAAVQRSVAHALTNAAGLAVDAVDVAIEELER
jgi:uncharacterized alkaline shock family protein YloU